MRATLSVKNWDQFQHYKDRNPPWIKLHNSLLEDYEFECLHDASKGHLLCIWMLASRTENKIPYDSEWVGRKIGASTPVDLDSLITAGFLVSNQPLPDVEHNASAVIADDKQSAIPEERRGEGETEENISPSGSSAKRADPIPYQQIVNSYNEHLPMLRRCIKITDKVRNTIRKSWNADKRHQTFQFWDRYFTAIPKLDKRVEFWSGVDGGSKQGIDLIARKDIFERTIEELVALRG